METIAQYILFGFLVLWFLAWTWVIWRWSAELLSGLSRTAAMDTTLRIIAWSALYALLALIPLFVALLCWSEFNSAFPA